MRPLHVPAALVLAPLVLLVALFATDRPTGRYGRPPRFTFSPLRNGSSPDGAEPPFGLTIAPPVGMMSGKSLRPGSLTMAVPPSTALSLLDRLRDGNAESWRRMNELYAPLLRAWLRPHGVQPADVHDLTQNALCREADTILDEF